ncbi:gas vesicle protein [Streptomyces sp. NPDC051684]|uniref:gas vesicle protein n=1 Tax=Streptomyces sp. NPDC051684 TaxID=3365670 RepID=UPI0037ADC5E8
MDDSSGPTDAEPDAKPSTNSDSNRDTHPGAKKKAPTRKTRDAPRRSESPAPQRSRKLRPAEAIREAREQLAELTGKPIESVSTFNATDDGWRLEVEVLELSRVPDTMSLLASYEVTLDDAGLLTGYRRLGRYERGRATSRNSG